MPKNRAPRAIDLRRMTGGAAAVGTGGGGTTTTVDHGALTGLADDDHTQYLTNGRGDARYPALASYNAHVADPDAHHARLHAITDTTHHSLPAGWADLDVLGRVGGLLGKVAPVSSAAGGVTALLKANAGALTLDTLTATTVAAGTVTASAKVRTPLIDTASGNLTLDAAGDQITIGASNNLRTANYASNTTGWAIDYPGLADFRFIQADELQVKIFTAVIEQAQAGRFMVAKSVAQLAYEFTAPAAGASTNFYVKDLPGAPDMAVFESDAVIGNSDFVSLHTFSRAAGGLTITSCYGRVQLVAGDTGPGGTESGVQKWLFSRSAGTIGAGNPPGAMAAGTVVSAEGSLVIDWGRSGDGYVETSAVDGPYNARNSPYTQVVTWTSDPVTGKAVRTRLGNLRGITGATEYGLWAGDTATGNIIVTGDKVALRQGTNDRIVLDSAGDSYFAGVMTIGTAGEIRQGTGTLGSNYTGLRLWRESNVGRIGGYNSDTLQWYGATDGKFYFGGGKDYLDANGINIVKSSTTWGTTGAVTFLGSVGGAPVGDLQFRGAGGTAYWRVGWNQTTAEGDAYIEATASSATQYIDVYGGNGAKLSLGGISESLAIITAGTSIGLDAPLTTVTGTLWVANAAATVNIGGAGATTGTALLYLGAERSGNGEAQIKLRSTGVGTYTDYGFLIRRFAGDNGATQITHQGTGNLDFICVQAAAFTVRTSNTSRITVLATGEVGIGKTPVSGRALDVNGDLVASGVVLGALRAVAGTAPASVTDAAGTVGDIRWDASYIYIKVADSGNRWRRAQLFTW